MTKLSRIAFIGNSLPRHCGIATFTTDLQQAIATSDADVETCIVAMTDNGNAYDYPSAVRYQVRDERIEDYVRAAGFLNAGRFDAVSLQHEFGIFGGEAGSHVMALLSRLTMPIVTTLHTVLAEPCAGIPRCSGPGRRCLVEDRRNGRKRAQAAAHRVPGSGRKD